MRLEREERRKRERWVHFDPLLRVQQASRIIFYYCSGSGSGSKLGCKTLSLLLLKQSRGGMVVVVVVVVVGGQIHRRVHKVHVCG